VDPHVGAAADVARAQHGLDQIQGAVELHSPRVVVLGDDVVIEARQLEPRIAARPQRRVGVLIDRRRQHHATVLFRIRRHIGAAAAERQTQRRARAEVARGRHDANLPFRPLPLDGVPMS
jgi:hypothetical protein